MIARRRNIPTTKPMISERLALFDDFLAESGLTLSIDVFFEFNADVYISTS